MTGVRAGPVAVTLLTGLTMLVSYAVKRRCTGPDFDAAGRSTPDYGIRHYRDFCYTDIQHLWLGRGVNEHVFPYLHGGLTSAGVLVGGAVEYPVLTGLIMWAGAVFAHTDRAWLTDSALLLAPFGLAVGWLLARLAGWRALVWAVGTPLLLYAFHNWDLPAVACAVGAVAVLHLPGPPERRAELARRANWAAVLLGLGFAVKLYPGMFLLPLALYVLTGGPGSPGGRDPEWSRKLDWAAAGRVVAAGVATVVVVNLPFAVLGPSGWRASFTFQRLRPVDVTTNSVWYWGFRPWSEPGNQAFQQVVGWVSPTLVLASFALAAALGWLRYRRTGWYPWVGVSAAMLAGFLLLHKVHSPQYALWLVPFFVLTRPRWGWVAGYFAADLALGLGIFRWFWELRTGQVGAVASLAEQAVIAGVWGRAALLVALFGLFPGADHLSAGRPGGPSPGRVRHSGTAGADAPTGGCCTGGRGEGPTLASMSSRVSSMGRSVRLTVCVVLAALAASSACTGPVAPTTPSGSESGLDLPSYDRSVRPQDDLYQFANGGWLRNTQIPPDMSEYGAFSALSQRAEDDQRTLVEAAESDGGAPIDSNERKIGDLYASFMDTARLEQLKDTPLRPYFATIDAVANPIDLVRHLGDSQRFGASSPIDLGVSQDAKDATHYVTEISQGGLSLPDRDYYLSTDPKMAAVRTQYRAYIAKMFTLAGQPDPEGSATAIFNLEVELAQAQWTNVRNRDALATYNKFNLATATKATGMDWANYLAAAGITDANLVIAQPTYFGTLNTLLNTTPIGVWKDYLRWHIIQDFAPYLSNDFVSARFDFVGTVLGGRPQNRERWRRGVTVVNTAMGDALGQLYVRKYFPPEAKDRAEALVQSIRAAYQTSVDGLDWMSPPSKAAAKDKLDKLAVKIGYPTEWKDYGPLRITRDDLVGNLDRAARVAHQRDVDKLGKPVDRDEWFMTPQTVNAYYNPSLNEIVFPAAILQPPFFDAKADNAVNYGAIGSVIGHEMSHGFDDQGRHYDSDGNLREWMAPADAAAFDKKTQALVAQYSGYQPLPGSRINGQLTLGENIADLSGLTESYKAYQASLGGQPGPELDGFTGDQRFFLGYGQIWRDKEREESLRSSLLTDPHSPGQFRADGVVPNVDAFYDAFGVKPGDKLYRAPQDRIHIW